MVYYGDTVLVPFTQVLEDETDMDFIIPNGACVCVCANVRMCVCVCVALHCVVWYDMVWCCVMECVDAKCVCLFYMRVCCACVELRQVMSNCSLQCWAPQCSDTGSGNVVLWVWEPGLGYLFFSSIFKGIVGHFFLKGFLRQFKTV